MSQPRLSIALPTRLEPLLVKSVNGCAVAAFKGDVCSSNLMSFLFRTDLEWSRVFLKPQTNGNSGKVCELLVTDGCESSEVPLYNFIETIFWDGDDNVVKHD